MTEKFHNKYRIQSNRLSNWNYSGDGMYFITLVTQNRICNLGKIIDVEMLKSDFGKIVENEWHKSFEMRDELFLDEYCIMPNHIHAIVIIDKTLNNKNCNNSNFNNTNRNRLEYDDINCNRLEYDDINRNRLEYDDINCNRLIVETHGRASLQRQTTPPQRQTTPPPSAYPTTPRKPKSISSFIAGFKSAVNSKIDDYIDEQKLNIPKYNHNNHFFQPNYYDHIIRNNNEYLRIQNYIANNLLNWIEDKFYE
jgi:putative transposase